MLRETENYELKDRCPIKMDNPVSIFYYFHTSPTKIRELSSIIYAKLEAGSITKKAYNSYVVRGWLGLETKYVCIRSVFQPTWKRHLKGASHMLKWSHQHQYLSSHKLFMCCLWLMSSITKKMVALTNHRTSLHCVWFFVFIGPLQLFLSNQKVTS